MTYNNSAEYESGYGDIRPRTTFRDLPEEVVSQILHDFDQDPPSISRGNQVPDVNVLHIVNSPLKASSCVCRAWRRIVFAQLFKTLRVPLEDVLPQWLYDEVPGDTDRSLRLCARGQDWSSGFVPIADGELWLSKQALRFYDFVASERLDANIKSLTLYASNEVIVGVDTYPEEGNTRTGHLTRKGNFMKVHRYLAATSLWRHLFSHLDPEHLIVYAPPVTLGSLMKSCIVEQSDAWAFEIKCQRFEFRQDKSVPKPPLTYRTTQLPPLQPNKVTSLDLLEHRPWTAFSYHGGSCMNAYGTYHYFEKMPPCLLTYNPLLTTILGPQLTHFTYTSVFAHFVHFRGITTLISKLDALEELTLQLAPAAGSEALDDIELISKGHMSLRDCWMEVERSYEGLTRTLLCREPEPVMPSLQRFTTYDCTKGALKEELEALFEQFAPGWTRVSEFSWECK